MSAIQKRALQLSLFLLAGIWIIINGQDPAGHGVENLLPYLSAVFLIYMHLPVQWLPEPAPLSPKKLALPAFLFVIGNLTGILLLQALGWLLAWLQWTDSRIKSSALPTRRSLWAFLFVFPWITHDLPEIGWWFRLSGAAVTETFFLALGFPVERNGTEMVVGGLPMSVEPGCAGMGLLQSLLVAGTLLLLFTYPRSRIFYFLLPSLPLLAWMANTLRIVTITAIGLSAGAEFSMGLFHTWGGLLVIVIMVLLCLPALWLTRRLVPEP